MKIKAGSTADLEKIQNVQLEKMIEKFGVEIGIIPPAPPRKKKTGQYAK